jgi:endonuclease/exonuclease/phosphatase family metal-dependent hydrolase
MRLSLILFTFFFCATSKGQDSLKVLTWNIFQRPGILNDHQNKRIKPSCEWLLDSKADIIVLQEVFKKSSLKKCMEVLKEAYPYSAVPSKKEDGLLKLNSGVAVFSKYPIKKRAIKIFTENKGADALAKKAAISLHFEIGDKKLQLIGTHLQASKGSEYDSIRISQVRELKELIDTTADAQIFVGDFNMAYKSKPYLKTLKMLGAINGKKKGNICCSSSLNGNGLFPESKNSKWIDFILLNKHSSLNYAWTKILHPSYNWGKSSFLSDHNPVISQFYF